MKVRYASVDDIATCIELGKRFHAMTRFASYPFNEARLARNLAALIQTAQNERKTHCFLIAENARGEILGGLIGCIERHFFSDLPVASVIHYDVLPEKRMSGAALKLLTAFREWARQRGAVEMALGINSGIGIEKTERFLQKLGLIRVGGNYMISLRT